MSGRIPIIVPFLPFSEGEQAVVAHKYILELQNRVIEPLKADWDRLVGHIRLSIRGDAAVCRHIAKRYDTGQGARSLKAAVDNLVEDVVISKYLEEETEIKAGQEISTFVVEVSQGEDLAVFKTS